MHILSGAHGCDVVILSMSRHIIRQPWTVDHDHHCHVTKDWTNAHVGAAAVCFVLILSSGRSFTLLALQGTCRAIKMVWRLKIKFILIQLKIMSI